MLKYFQRLRVLRWMSSLPRRHPCRVNACSLVPNKLPLTAEQLWAQSYLKNLPS